MLALALCFLIRLAGKCVTFHDHPVLAGFFKVDPLYLDSVVDVLTSPADPALAFLAGNGFVGVSLATPVFRVAVNPSAPVVGLDIGIQTCVRPEVRH